MDLKKTLDVLNAMEADRIIGRYAIAGAVAAYRYLEPTLTQDLDVLVSFEPKAALISLDSIFSYLKARGFENFENEGIVVGGWPVQFIPVTDRLDVEALADAVEVEIAIPQQSPVRTRLLSAEYLVAIALRTGRPKDHIRIIQFMESKSVNIQNLCDVLRRNELLDKWRLFCIRVGIANPCG
jgi:hypothetical protein